jgi:methylenetetrahydrofolate reductase (NADPH)
MSKVPGIFVPDEFIRRLEAATNQEEEGIKLAAELARDYFSICDGVHLIAIKGEEKLIEVMNAAGIKKSN